VAAVKEGSLSIHRLKRSLDGSHSREITTLMMEIQQIMKGTVVLWSTQCTVHSAQYTVHSKQCTVHSAQYTVHSAQLSEHQNT
jgi:hypothetical protein